MSLDTTRDRGLSRNLDDGKLVLQASCGDVKDTSKPCPHVDREQGVKLPGIRGKGLRSIVWPALYALVLQNPLSQFEITDVTDV